MEIEIHSKLFLSWGYNWVQLQLRLRSRTFSMRINLRQSGIESMRPHEVINRTTKIIKEEIIKTGKKQMRHLPCRILHIMPYFLRCTSLRRDLNKSFVIELNSWLLLHITEKPPLSQKWSFATARNDDDQPHEFHWKGSDFSNSRNFPNRRERFWPPNSIWWIFQVFLHFFTIFTWEIQKSV